MDNEVWKPVPNYEGLYEISNLGKIRSLYYITHNTFYNRIRVMKPQNNGTGYLKVQLYKNGKKEAYLIHRLVASVFIPNPENLPQVNHKDENKLNNNVENLEWCTHLYNHHYGTRQMKQTKTQQTKRGIPIIQKDMNNNIINKYVCLREANRKTGIGRKEICLVCKGIYKQAGGYRWEYDR